MAINKFTRTRIGGREIRLEKFGRNQTYYTEPGHIHNLQRFFFLARFWCVNRIR